jgi:hypothetical protein
MNMKSETGGFETDPPSTGLHVCPRKEGSGDTPYYGKKVSRVLLTKDRRGSGREKISRNRSDRPDRNKASKLSEDWRKAESEGKKEEGGLR